mmetsp:Transcript_125743/g.288037  ORF Transcript_125743/g.288037 Transcript_125743/m.288037 type:complete len:202 (-) Transcript_125743:219-824(-)
MTKLFAVLWLALLFTFTVESMGCKLAALCHIQIALFVRPGSLAVGSLHHPLLRYRCPWGLWLAGTFFVVHHRGSLRRASEGIVTQMGCQQRCPVALLVPGGQTVVEGGQLLLAALAEQFILVLSGHQRLDEREDDWVEDLKLKKRPSNGQKRHRIELKDGGQHLTNVRHQLSGNLRRLRESGNGLQQSRTLAEGRGASGHA